MKATAASSVRVVGRGGRLGVGILMNGQCLVSDVPFSARVGKPP